MPTSFDDLEDSQFLKVSLYYLHKSHYTPEFIFLPFPLELNSCVKKCLCKFSMWLTSDLSRVAPTHFVTVGHFLPYEFNLGIHENKIILEIKHDLRKQHKDIFKEFPFNFYKYKRNKILKLKSILKLDISIIIFFLIYQEGRGDIVQRTFGLVRNASSNELLPCHPRCS